MFPILFTLGPIRVYTYVIFLILAFFAGLFVVWKRGREMHFDETEWLESVLLMLGSGILMARIFYSLEHVPWLKFSGSGLIAAFSRFGLSPVGGVLGALLYYWNVTKKRKWEFWTGLDVLSAGMALMLTILSIGNFIGGSGYGVATKSFIGIHFSGTYDKRIPVQLFEAVWYGVLFTFLWRVEANWRTFGWYKGSKSEAQSGFLISIFTLFTGLGILIANLMRPAPELYWGIRSDLVWPGLFVIISLVVLNQRSGLGLKGMIRYWLKEWGLTGGLVDNWRYRQGKGKYEKLKLGDDIFT